MDDLAKSLGSFKSHSFPKPLMEILLYEKAQWQMGRMGFEGNTEFNCKI